MPPSTKTKKKRDYLKTLTVTHPGYYDNVNGCYMACMKDSDNRTHWGGGDTPENAQEKARQNAWDATLIDKSLHALRKEAEESIPSLLKETGYALERMTLRTDQETIVIKLSDPDAPIPLNASISLTCPLSDGLSEIHRQITKLLPDLTENHLRHLRLKTLDVYRTRLNLIWDGFPLITPAESAPGDILITDDNERDVWQIFSMQGSRVTAFHPAPSYLAPQPLQPLDKKQNAAHYRRLSPWQYTLWTANVSRWNDHHAHICSQSRKQEAKNA